MSWFKRLFDKKKSKCATGNKGDLQNGAERPRPRFVISGDCVTDNLTGLMWAKNANMANFTKTWQEALDYVD